MIRICLTHFPSFRPISEQNGLSEGKKIAIEIKSFLNVSQVTDLERAIGQYELYKRLLKKQDTDRELWLAVPTYAFEGIFRTPVGEMAVEEFRLKLIVYSISEEELLWKI